MVLIWCIISWTDFGSGDSAAQVQHWEDGEDRWNLADIQRWRRNRRFEGILHISFNATTSLTKFRPKSVFLTSVFCCHLSMQTPLEALQEQCNTTSATNSHVVLQLEHAQSLLLQFSEGLGEVSPWLEETQTLIGQLSLSTISYEAFREQQDLLQVEETCLSPFECQLFFSFFFITPFSVLFNKEVLLCFTFSFG